MEQKDYTKWETAALLEHAKFVTDMIREAKPSTAGLIDELAKRSKALTTAGLIDELAKRLKEHGVAE